MIFFFSDVPGCGGDRHGVLFGEIQSPNHPEMYPNDLHCEWNITVPKGFRINITFTIFDLESFYMCEYDWISLRSGNATLGKFCGSMFPKPNWKHKALPSKYSISPTNECILTFHSDYSNEEHYSGFIAHYAAIGKLHFTCQLFILRSWTSNHIHSHFLYYIDEDECNDQNGGCDHYCHNYIGGYYCSCKAGYRKQTDGKSCNSK